MPLDPAEVLLCESCGYVLDGLDEDAKCSECGRPVVESLAERRSGSPFQVDPTPRGWWRTAWRMMTGSPAVFRVMRIDEVSARVIEKRFATLVGGMIVLPAWLAGLAMLVVEWRFLGWAGVQMWGLPAWASVLLYGASLPAWWIVAPMIFQSLTAIERRGIRFFGARRGWRITPVMARSICAHAHIGGWFLGAIVPGVIFWIAAIAMLAAIPTARQASQELAGPWVLLLTPLLGVAYAVGFGLIPFELQVFLGVRACRFANRATLPGPSRGSAGP